MDGGDGHLWRQRRRHLARIVVVTVEKIHRVNGGRSNLSICSVLQDDGVRGFGHRLEGGVLQGGDASIWRERIKENNLKKGVNVRQAVSYTHLTLPTIPLV